LRLDDVGGGKGGGPDRTDLARSHQIGEHGQGVLDVSVRHRTVMSRRPFTALPTTSSDPPWLYASAVSMKMIRLRAPCE
jgi:hypothetical protein